MPHSPKNFEEKPYNSCIDCIHIGRNCDGPNFLAMEMTRLSEWCRLRKEYLHRSDPKWTNAYIAEQAGLSKVSVDRFLSGNADDLKISTTARILKVLVNGTWGQYPCSLADVADQSSEDLSAECARLKSELESAKSESQQKIAFLREQIEFKEKQMVAKDKILQDNYDFIKRKNSIIGTLSLFLGITVFIIIAALVIDRLNPDMGFFWLSQLFDAESSVFNKLI